jgi:signal transduction histidine kinase
LGVEKKEVDVYKDVIAPALADVAQLAVEHQVVIDHNASLRDGEILIKTDPSCLKTVYRNLFSNAIRYGGKRARVAYGIEDAGAEYRFNVWNSGSGIPQAEIPLLFKRFSRLDSNKGMVKGSGLGLYNTRGILEALGGKISVQSDGHSFANFIFTLPKE